MAPLKKLSFLSILQRRRTHFMFTTFLALFSLLILRNSSITPKSLTSITYSTSPSVSSATFHLLSATNYISSLSSINTNHENTHDQNGSILVDPPGPTKYGSQFANNFTSVQRNTGEKDRRFDKTKKDSCDIFDGKWVLDDSDPIYSPGSCPFLDYTFNCFNNGRSDLGYLSYKWQPNGCDIPRFDGRKMLDMLRGKRMVFVGDSLNRNMWQSLICSLRMSLVDKKRMVEVSQVRKFRTEGFYSFKVKDYNCTIEFIRSPFLVQEWKVPSIKGGAKRREMLRLDLIQATTSKYHDADFLIFNTGHWWTHHKTRNGKNFFLEGNFVHSELNVTEAYTKALKTWAKWVDKNVNKKKTQVFFAGYSASHFRGGQWNSGGNCDGETEPIRNDTHLAPYPWMMKILESMISEMKTPVVYLNITKMTGYRKDAHPSIYRQPGTRRRHGMIQDCSHWCLPGVPDSWNHLLYASLFMSSQSSIRTQ
ncbi:protein trichome birefringence-like 4 [Amaranthus tricolor]|uniref:protein trichome birefringence-like 4 n=1 Tax=Amaranthus tricolor TaxID=29722 RepID=UPI00258F9938|nr:protein trichome birefringence-like 4 [Amaranthus tricolor]